MAKRKPPESGGGGGSWMDTYGDMVTLLLTFFVLLFSFSEVDAKKWEELVASFSGVTHLQAIAPLSPGALEPGVEGMGSIVEEFNSAEPTLDPSATANVDDTETFDQLFEEIDNYIVENDLQSQIDALWDDGKIIMRIRDSALFDSGSDRIKPAGAENLEQVAEILDRYETSIKQIYIEGHTDPDPINTSQFPDNWALSSGRARSVLLFILEHTSNIEPQKLIPSGRADSLPVASNDTAEGKAQNRRVDFIIESTADTP